MAMGQGEQRAIHPFFRKDFGVSTSSFSPVPTNDALLEPNGSHLSNGSQPTPSVAAFDHDPNLDRRKRRKTNKDAPEVLETSRSADNHEPPRDNLEIEVESLITSTKTSERSESRDHEYKSPVSGKEQSQQRTTEVPDATQNGPNDDAEKKRKVIKLNANGKLLSSPIANKLGEKSKTRCKRGKSAAYNIEDPQSKIVVFKYHSQPGSFESLGKQIEDILAGREKYSARTVLSTAPAAVPKVVSNQPAKATHPFFLKKAAPKPDISISQPQTPVPAAMLPVDEQPRIKPVYIHSASKPLMSFQHTFSKVPEPVQPLWPPLGLSHVRGTQQILKPCHDNHYQNLDSRKSKTPAVRIIDEEYLISSTTDSSDGGTTVLRVPERQLASGRALQMMVAKELIKTPTEHVGGGSHKEASHPAIMKLYSSLTTSMTAFDLGGYESQLWAHKYAPNSAQQVLCATKEALMLRDWLNHLIVSSVETGSSSKDDRKLKKKEEKKRKRRKKADKLDGFVVDSDDEASEMDEISGSDDELAGDVTISTKKTVFRTGDLTINVRSGTERARIANTILVSGPSGCGKTASVYAVAKEMGFEVFEINSGSRRSAKDILDRLGDMTQNHLVHNAHANRDSASNQVSSADLQPCEDAKQNKVMGFFRPTTTGPPKKPGKGRAKASVKEKDTTQARSQKQSLILLEEVDILFEEDKQFWTGVLTLINQSKRPIIMTCNDESLIPFDGISFHAILRYRTPPQDLAVDYLLLVAASEGHLLRRAPIEKLYRSTDGDLRKSIIELNYWCQIAVGSEKSGLDWLIDRWPQGADLDESGDKLRVLSKETYREYMGWLSRDILIAGGSSATSELQEETLNWWDLSLQNADTTEDSRHQFWASPNPGASRLELLDSLRHQSEHMDFRSDLDVLGTSCSLDARKDSVDTSIPPMPGRQKLSYVEGYQLLSADRVPDYSALASKIGSTFGVILNDYSRKSPIPDPESMLAAKVLAAIPTPKSIYPSGIELCEALVPVMRPDCTPTPSIARAELSYDYSLRHFAEDITPYVRAIVAFDLRLEQYRLELSRLLSGNGRGTKRVRTTRASRAALEGGSKSETRKERWFSPTINVPRILATGQKEWQDLLVQNGYFTVPVVGEQRTRENSEPISESASDIA